MTHWVSFIYLYGVGGLLFALAIYLGIRKGVLKLNRKSDRHILIGMVGAYLLYFSFQGAWNLLAILTK